MAIVCGSGTGTAENWTKTALVVVLKVPHDITSKSPNLFHLVFNQRPQARYQHFQESAVPCA